MHAVRKIFHLIVRILARFSVLSFGLVVALAFALALYLDFNLLSETSYRLVSLFLILIVLSNVLAKLGIVYLDI